MTETVRYRQIADNIKNKIYSGIYKPNSLLPYEKDLCAEYNVSRLTIRKAINELVVEGCLYTVAGKGTFVYETSQFKYSTDVTTGSFFSKGYTATRLIYANIAKPDIYEVYNLRISPDEKIISIKWVVERDGVPIAYDVKNIPYLSGIPIEERDLGYSSLFEILSEKYTYSDLKLKGMLNMEIPTPEVAKHLELNEKSREQVVKFQLWLSDDENDVYGWNTIYILPDEFLLQGESV